VAFPWLQLTEVVDSTRTTSRDDDESHRNLVDSLLSRSLEQPSSDIASWKRTIIAISSATRWCWPPDRPWLSCQLVCCQWLQHKRQCGLQPRMSGQQPILHAAA